MSLINDALIKAERERAEEAAARAAGLPVEHPKYRAEKRRRSRQLQSIPLAIINTVVLLACFAVIILIVIRNRPASDPPSIAATPANSDVLPLSDRDVDTSSTFAASDSLALSPSLSDSASDSPFDAPTSSPIAAPPSTEFELVGMSAVGNTTLLGINRRSDQRSVWVPVGKSVSGITALSYDAASDRAVIEVNGRQLTLGLRAGAPIPAE